MSVLTSTTALTLPITLLPTLPGAGSSPDVGSIFDVAIAGEGYMVDWARGRDALRHSTANLLRPQADTGSTTGEQSINPEGPWRRTTDSWHVGAGQANLDRPNSDPARFEASFGVDVWTESQVTMLPTVAEALNSSATNLDLLVAGDRLYCADGQTLKYTTDPFAGTPTWTTVTGTPASAIESLCTDGFYVYASYGTNGIYETNTGVSTAASWVTGTIGEIAYVRGRFLAESQGSIHEITLAPAAGATALASADSTGSPIFAPRSTQFSVVGITETLNHIYFAGFAGDKSEVYRISITADGTDLAAPVQAAQLPDGEIVTAVYGYLGFVILGTTKGIRFSVPDANGDLQIGALIDIGQTVRCFEGQGRFVWFGWESFTAATGGLGRIDLTTFSDTDALVPAYASDLLASSTGDTVSVATFDNKRVFSMSTDGVYAEDDDRVLFGQIESGNISFGLGELKTAFDYVLTADFTDGGGVQVSLATDEGTYSVLGAATSSGTSTMTADEASGNRFRSKLLMTRSSTDTTKGPTLYSGTLRAFPRVEATNYITCALVMRPIVRGLNGYEVEIDTSQARAQIQALHRTQQITTFQEGSESWSVLISNVVWEGEAPSHETDEPFGTLLVEMKVVS